ncbi:hypothetical protein TI05_07680 [Achromatium sp. WMS3]|nr:hypothetical protein TI03_01850 [Achromatium sp. WMS1]KOR32372.1 hypothetical protein TI05_07680 [Achromatium sp. WMS3]
MYVSINEAQLRLPELIKQLAMNDEIVITEEERPIARLVSQAYTKQHNRIPGSAKGKLRIITEDTAHLDDFKDYMP